MQIAKVYINEVYARSAYCRHIPKDIRGATVALEYAEPVWSGLVRNVVFTNGVETVGVLNAGAEVYLPPEVVSIPGLEVRVGVCGVGEGDQIVIPTLWATIGEVQDATPTDFDEAAAQLTPTVLAQLLGMIGPLDSLTTEAKENLVAAVNEVYRNSGGNASGGEFVVTVRGSEADGYTRDVTNAEVYEAYSEGRNVRCVLVDDGIPIMLAPFAVSKNFSVFSAAAAGLAYMVYLTDDPLEAKAEVSRVELSTEDAIPTKTSQLENDSGFLTEHQELPTTLPNPHALTFTGALEATYDGSGAVSLEIPQGGGGVTPTGAEQILFYTVDADGASASSFVFTVDEYPKLAEYNHLRGIVKQTTNGGMPWYCVALNTTGNTNNLIGKGSATSYSMFAFEIVKKGDYYLGGVSGAENPTLYAGWKDASLPAMGRRRFTPLHLPTLESINIASWTQFLDEGGTIEIWGWNE